MFTIVLLIIFSFSFLSYSGSLHSCYSCYSCFCYCFGMLQCLWLMIFVYMTYFFMFLVIKFDFFADLSHFFVFSIVYCFRYSWYCYIDSNWCWDNHMHQISILMIRYSPSGEMNECCWWWRWLLDHKNNCNFHHHSKL